jgi:hypothetical protein
MAGPYAFGKMKEGHGQTSWVNDPFFKPTATLPNTQNCSHRVGNVFLTITNYGFFGSKFWQSQLREEYCSYTSDSDPLGDLAPSFEFPAGSGINYLFQGALWIAAIVEDDTLCSVGADGWQWIEEMYPAAAPDGALIRKSNRQGSIYYDPDAISEQDYYAVYTDTTLDDGSIVGIDPVDNRRHKPMYLEVNQRSYSWSYKYAEDFILIDFMLRNIGLKTIRKAYMVLRNIGLKTIRKAYMGLYIDADIWDGVANPEGYKDDYSGYLPTYQILPGVNFEYPINIAWTADNDGDPVDNAAFDQASPIGVAGTRVVRSPIKGLQYSFNWWVSNGDNVAYDWGPMMADNYRDYGTGGLGTPEGDKNKYYILSNNEFDYDQLYSAVDYSDQGWLPPPSRDLATDLADGFDTRYLFSFGPLHLEPADSLLITIAYVAGDNFHAKPYDFKQHYKADNPGAFYQYLDFRDLALNASWAAWIYDNPGVDTDGDGIRGEVYVTEDGDSIWYEGDGVPDFTGPPPPPAPILRYSAVPGQVTIYWNGQYTEEYLDPFSKRLDFEGYRVYMSDDLIKESFALLTSADLLDYNRYTWDEGKNDWQLREFPLSPDSLEKLYGEGFDPLEYDENNPYTDQDGNIYYFKAVDWNRPLGVNIGEIHKTYQPQIDAGSVTDSVGIDEHPDNYVSVGDTVYHKYWEYKYTLDNLLPSKEKYFAVTAFDFGNPENELEPLETSPLVNAIRIFPVYSADQVEEQGIGVSVYPNPYRIDAGYSSDGYEGSDIDPERERRIHFINLPEVCTIKIWTTDGDLVRKIEHFSGGPYSDTNSKAYWDMISRNTQAIVSGLYIYSIESESGTQIGKIVIIK